MKALEANVELQSKVKVPQQRFFLASHGILKVNKGKL